ncbi:MAG: hypothetical protein ABG776_02560 [Cyanobacteria bacterium J06555_13]
MLTTRFGKIGSAFLLALPIVSLLPQQLHAQRSDDFSDFLLNGATCVVSGPNSNYSRIFSTQEAVSINRQAFNREFSIGATQRGDTLLSCNVDTDQFGLVSLQMGAGDESVATEAVMRIGVYHGGNLRHTYNSVQAGSNMVNVLLDLEDPAVASNPGSFSIEVSCRAYGNQVCYLHFIEAKLHPASGFASTDFSGNSAPASSFPPAPTSADQAPVSPSAPPVSEPSQSPTSNPSHPRPPWK